MSILKNYCDVEYGKALPERQRIPGKVKVYGSAGESGTHETALYKEPLIVVGRKGNISGVHKVDGPSWVIDTAYALLPSEKLDRDYLYYFLKYNAQYFASNDQSTAIPSLAREILYSLKINVPNLTEQKSIVSKIDTLFAKIDTGCEELKRTKQNLELYRQSILNAAVSGKLFPKVVIDDTASAFIKEIYKKRDQLVKDGTLKKEREFSPISAAEVPFELPRGWEWVRLAELGKLARGKSKHRPRNDPKLFVEGKYPLVQTGDVASAQNTDYKIISFHSNYNDFGLVQSKLWPEGTLCITIAANIAEVGFLSFPACFPDSIVAFHPYSEELLKDYVFTFIRATRKQIETFAPATAQKNINLGILEELLVPVPPKSLLAPIIKTVNELSKTISDAEKTINAHEALISSLRLAILKSAFEGKLV